MSTYAHVTVTVVADGVTTTYDIAKVKDFERGTEVDRSAIMDDDELRTLRFHPARWSLTFKMRPLPTGDGRIYTITTDAP